MVRCALFRYGHPQKLSLCLMNHGLFCGLLEKIHGGSANLDILHAGENDGRLLLGFLVLGLVAGFAGRGFGAGAGLVEGEPGDAIRIDLERPLA